jgi:hypothetical protein
MKALKKSLAVGLLSCFALVGPSLTDAWAASADKATMTTADAEPVNQLRALYASNAEFKKTMDEALALPSISSGARSRAEEAGGRIASA